MNDDWRLRITLEDSHAARELTSHLHAGTGGAPATRLHERVIVSRDDNEVFCYTARREEAEAAAQTIRALAADQGWQAAIMLERWHPIAERWEDPDAPLPDSPSAAAREHAERVESERRESAAQEFPEFEVRVRTPSRRDAQALAERLTAEGIAAAHRWEFVAVGADDEDAAEALAERLRAEAPAGSEVMAQASLGEIAQEAPGTTPFTSPFSVFGGLGG